MTDINFKKLYFDEKTGHLKGMCHNNNLYNINSEIWNIELIDKSSVFNVSPDDSMNFRFEYTEKALTLFWENETISVIVTLNDKDGFSHWHIAAESKSETKKINKVVFPIIKGLSAIKEKDCEDYLLLPYQNGWLIKNPADDLLQNGEDGLKMPFYLGRGEKKYEAEYPASFNFQFFSYYSGNTGFYFATQDSEAYTKTYRYALEEENDFSFSLINYPEGMGETKSYSMPYDFVMKLYDGQWQQAVNYYREWAIKQKWCRQTLREKGINDSVKKTDLWRINHMNYALGTRTQEYLDTCKIIKEKTKANLAIHWYGWNMGAHDVNYPEYISRERYAEHWDDELKKWTEKMKKEEIVKIPYVNARLWDKYSPSWKEENAIDSAIKNEKGEIFSEPWNGDRLVPICPSTYQWQRKVADFCKNYIDEFKFDGLYLDQIASFNATLCFDKSHPHARGGGNWWNKTYHDMVSMVRKNVDEKTFLTTESCCETYIDAFDMLLVLDTDIAPNNFFNEVLHNKNAQPVPLFSMIYGKHSILYGSICRFCDPVDVFEYKFMRNILWGIWPTIEGFAGEEIEDKASSKYFDVVKKGTDFFKERKEEFLYARLCAIPDIECDDAVLEWNVNGEKFTRTYPAIIATQWEYENGEKAYLLYNTLSEDKEVVIENKTIYLGAKKFTVTGRTNN